MGNTMQPTVKQIKATNKVYKLRETMNDDLLSKLLKLSKVTLYTRLKKHNWTDAEILFVEYKSNTEFSNTIDSLGILK